jgi:protein TonB
VTVIPASSGALRVFLLGASAAVHAAAFVALGHPPPGTDDAQRPEDIAVDELVPPVETQTADPPPDVQESPAPFRMHKPPSPDHNPRWHDPSTVHAPTALAENDPVAPSSAPADSAPSVAAPARFTLVVGNTGVQPGAATAQTAIAGLEPGGDATPFAESDVSAPARALEAIAPPYPPGARAEGVEADVVVAVVVTAEGRVSDARVERRAGFGFDEAAVAAVRAARFLPARRDGRPVAVRMRLAYAFRLR